MNYAGEGRGQSGTHAQTGRRGARYHNTSPEVPVTLLAMRVVKVTRAPHYIYQPPAV